MDAVSYSLASKQAQRIEKFIENPDSTSGIVTVPKTIASGETITIPAGRVAVLPNVQIDGILNVEGEVFIPSGATFGRVVEKVTSTDNAIVRFDGVTGAVQNSSVTITDSGALLLTSGTGGLGYGTESGGTVTQLTSKSTLVTLNKPSGIIVTHNTSLAAGATVFFQVNNSLILVTDTINVILADNANYDVMLGWNTNGGFVIKITNITGSSLSEVLNIHFTIIKGAIS